MSIQPSLLPDAAITLSGRTLGNVPRLGLARRWLSDSGLAALPSDPDKRKPLTFGHYVETHYGTLNVIQPYTNRLRLDPTDVLAQDAVTKLFYRITPIAFERDYIFEMSPDGGMMSISKKN